MAERPILFSGPMVRALLDGRKTQTRRTLKFQPAPGISIVRKTIRPLDAEPYHAFERRSVYGNYAGELDIKMKRGDLLWCREAWRCNGWATDLATIFYAASEGAGYTAMCEQYPVSGKHPLRITAGWRPSIHMPRWASRLTLSVTDVRVEKLQDITEADAVAEGCFKGKASGRVFNNPAGMHLGGAEWSNARDWYADTWESINGEGTWDANPWVAAYTFTVERRNIDAPASKPSGGQP